MLPFMDAVPQAASLLEELDRRQDEVLAQLEELESRITDLLRQYGAPPPVSPALHPLESQREAA